MTTSACLPTSVSRARFARLVAASLLALSLSAAPAFAAEDVVSDGGAEAEEQEAGQAEEEGSGKIQLAERPRDRVGLILLGFLGATTALGVVTMNRQMRGKRPQATGEFRWR
jgi:hypothetical protein